MNPGQLDDDGGGRVGGGGARRLSARPVALVDEVGGVGDRWDVTLRPCSCEYRLEDSVVHNVGEGFGARGLVLGHRKPEEADGVASCLLVPAVGHLLRGLVLLHQGVDGGVLGGDLGLEGGDPLLELVDLRLLLGHGGQPEEGKVKLLLHGGVRRNGEVVVTHGCSGEKKRVSKSW